MRTSGRLRADGRRWRRALISGTWILAGGLALAIGACTRAAPPAGESLVRLDLARVQNAGEPKRVLVVTHTAGFRHGSIPTAQQVLREMGEKSGLWTTEFATNAEEVAQRITAANLARTDLVIFANTTGELPVTDEGKAAFQEWLTSGKGFVGMHSATDTFYRWPFFGRMIAGYFDGHPWHQKIVVRVEDRAFPGCESLGESFEITDEIYQFRDWTRSDKHVVLSVDNRSIDVSRGKRSDQDYAIAWARQEGKGRVFYTSLGHRDEVWRDPRYQAHLLGGIRWALGLVQEIGRAHV